MPDMEYGLSKRMLQGLEGLPAPVSAAAPPAHSRDTIDLSNAQNEVLRPELVELFKSTVEDKVTSQSFNLPSTFGGDIPARESLASFFNQYFDPVHEVLPDHIVLTAGASDALENLVHAICEDGDSILVPGPSWHGFTPLLKTRANITIITAQPPTYSKYDNYLTASLRAVYDFSAKKSRIKAVLVCNPQNPLGRCYTRQAVLELMEFCQENELHLIVDEMYALTELNDDGDDGDGIGGRGGCREMGGKFVSAMSLTEPLARSGAVKVDRSRVHVVWSPSKVFGMSGLRVGCIISQSNPPLLTALSHLTKSHTSSISSTFLTTLLSWSQLPTLLRLNNERLTSNYHLLAAKLRDWNIPYLPPTHGLFLFAKLAQPVRSAEHEAEFYEGLAKQEVGGGGVVLAQGRLFKGVEGEYGWCRIRFSLPKDKLVDALNRIEKFLGHRHQQQQR